MKQPVVAACTVLVFFAGAIAGRMYEFHRPLPAPPGAFMGEFGGHRYNGQGFAPRTALSRADFVAEVERLKPQFEDFRRHMDEIEDEFERSLDPVLTPVQRAANAERLKRRAQDRAAEASRPHDENLMRLARAPNMALLRTVTLQMGYDYLNRDLKFEPEQKPAVIELLKVRRDHFLAFIDSSPLPSLQLLPLAPYAQRLAPAAAPEAPKPGGQP
jgi:hypothetical protein